MQSKATTVEAYLDELPEDRRSAIEAVLKLIRKNIDKKTEERIIYGMIGFVIPHKVYPPGYHCDPKLPLGYIALASQKNYMSLYMYCDYVRGDGNADESWFRSEWAKTGKKLDMGKCCLRFKKLDDLALDLIGQAIKRMSVKDFIANYEAALANTKTYSKAKKK